MIQLNSEKEFPNSQFCVKRSKINAAPHTHKFFELMYVKRGPIHHSINMKPSDVMKTGDFLFIDLTDFHEYKGENIEVVSLMFTPQIIDKRIDMCKNITDLLKNRKFGLNDIGYIPFPVREIMHDEKGMIWSIVSFLEAEANKPSRMSVDIIRHVLISLILKIIQPMIDSNTPNTRSNVIEQVIKIIEEDYAKDNLLVNAAERMNYSMTYLSTRFKEEIGVTFKEYLQKYRIDEAKYLLEFTNKKIYNISSEVGYSDIKFFNKLFKKYTNMSASQYRRLAKQSVQN